MCAGWALLGLPRAEVKVIIQGEDHHRDRLDYIRRYFEKSRRFPPQIKRKRQTVKPPLQ